MTSISVSEIQRDLWAYLERVQAGETLVILDGDRPLAELRPVAAPQKGFRPFGLCAGEFRVPDDFDDPLPEEIYRRFIGK